MFDFNGKTVLVTGAAGGIGVALVTQYLAWGAKVLAVDRSEEAINSIALASPNLHKAAFDLTDLDSTRAEIGSFVQVHGMDILINNAGAAAATALATLTPEAWRHDIDINLNAPYYCVEAVKDTMIARRSGVIVNIGTVNALLALGHPAYSAAKAGLISYTKSLALELGQYGIRANLVAPGTVKTQAWNERARLNPQIFEELRRWYPLRDFASPEDVANATAFLACDLSRAITGVVLPVDGGLTAGNTRMAAELTLESF